MRVKILLCLFYLCLFSIILGPLGAIPLGISQVNVYLTDIIVGLMALIWIINFRQAIKLMKTDTVAKYYSIFLAIAALSLVFSPIHINLVEKFISSLYLVRLFSYFFVYLTARNLIFEKIISADFIIKLLIISGLILASLGWLQYFLYPDLRNLYYLGWDPHFKRIFSTYLDPNYFGLILVLTLILLLALVENYYLKTFRLSPIQSGIARRIISACLFIFIFVTLMFSYSRSSFLALAGAVFYFSIIQKRFKLVLGILLSILISAILLPRPGGAGVQLERVFSIETRVENWQQAFKIFTDHPILGIGFNTIRYGKNQYNFDQDNLSSNHAGAGFDNSFLFIAATTGILGLASFLIFLHKIFQRANIWVRTSLIAIIIHSLFLNSLFFPWIMLWMMIVLGMNFME